MLIEEERLEIEKEKESRVEERTSGWWNRKVMSVFHLDSYRQDKREEAGE